MMQWSPSAFRPASSLRCSPVQRRLQRRRRRQFVAGVIVGGVDAVRGLGGQGEQEQALGVRRVVPDLREVVRLRPQHTGHRLLDVGDRGPAPAADELPREVRQLLGRVRVSVRRGQEPLERLVVDPLPGGAEALADEECELLRLNHPDLELLRAAPERLVAVAEDSLQQVALAAEVHVADLRLRLEDRAHQVREPPVEREDLLELVEDDRDASLALCGELADELEQSLDRVVDVGSPPTRLEREPQGAVARVDLDRRRHA